MANLHGMWQAACLQNNPAEFQEVTWTVAESFQSLRQWI